MSGDRTAGAADPTGGRRSPDAAPDPAVVAFLARAAREFLRGGWVFTGFHWPVLAGQVAARCAPEAFAQLFEAGATVHGPADDVPTSTTDYAAFGGAPGWRGGTADVLRMLVRRADRVVLDAGNVDLRGRVNATAIGPHSAPRVRLPGGGGAADAAAAARELVLLCGDPAAKRFVPAVEHVTAAPSPGTPIRLHLHAGVLRLDGEPRFVEIADAEAAAAVGDRLGIPTAGAPAAAPPEERESAAAEAVLRRAAERGYRVAREAFGGRRE